MEGRRGLGDPPHARILLAPSPRVEAAVGAGAAGFGRSVDRTLCEDWAVHARVSWAMPVVAACRGLVADGRRGRRSTSSARWRRPGATRPIDRAKIHLWYGGYLRRQRRRVEARDHLRAARDVRVAGRAPWPERAERELRATARRRASATSARWPSSRRRSCSRPAVGEGRPTGGRVAAVREPQDRRIPPAQGVRQAGDRRGRSYGLRPEEPARAPA